VGQVGNLRADCQSAQPGASPVVLRSFAEWTASVCGSRVGWARVGAFPEKLPGFARLARLTIGPQVTSSNQPAPQCDALETALKTIDTDEGKRPMVGFVIRV